MKLIRKKIYVILLIVLLLLMIGAITLKRMLNQSNQIASDLEIEENLLLKEENEPTNEPEESSKKMYVDIKGLVNVPGVYEIDESTRVIDVINQAGGILDGADTSNINLACLLKDEDVIIISSKENNISILENDGQIEKENIVVDKKEENSKEESKTIDLNTASLEDLITVPGIGEKKAQDIIDYRLEHGRFESVEDLKQISGIGDATFEKIRSYFKV